MKLTNGKEIYVVNDIAIIDAFKASGYSEVVEKPKTKRKTNKE